MCEFTILILTALPSFISEATSNNFHVNKSRIYLTHIYFSLVEELSQTTQSSEHNPSSKKKKRRTYSKFSLLQFVSYFQSGEEKYLLLFSIIKYVNFIHFMKKNNDKKIKTNLFFSLSLFVNLESSCIA